MAIRVRPAISTDVQTCVAFDHSTETEQVWTMDQRVTEGGITLMFRTVRLPRAMRVRYPRDPRGLVEEWARRECLLVAELDGVVCGYLNLSAQPSAHVGWVGDLAVARPYRRRGVGTALLEAAERWARERGLMRVIIEMQSKNYPAIHFCTKHGLTFCGYNDRYYANQDVALFFGRNIRG